MVHPEYSLRSSRSIPWIIISRLIGLAIFFIIVMILPYVETHNPTILSIIAFFTAPATIALVVVFSLLFLVGEVLLVLDFPLSLPGPFFNALGSVFLVSFLLQILYLVDQIGDIAIFHLLRPLEALLYLLVFLIVLIVQYVRLFSHRENHLPPRRERHQIAVRSLHTIPLPIPKTKTFHGRMWRWNSVLSGMTFSILSVRP